jgi:O-antigen/teichoic acid export membrane protein
MAGSAAHLRCEPQTVRGFDDAGRGPHDELAPQDPSTLGAKASRGAIVQFIGRLAQAAIQMVAVVVISRILGPDEVGVAVLAMTVVALPGVFRDFGLGLPTLRRNDLTHELVTALFWVSVAAGVALGALVSVASPFVSRFYDDPRIGKAMLVLAIEFVVSGLAVQHSALLRRNFRNVAIVVTDVIAESGALIVGVTMALSDAGYVAIVTRMLAFQIIRIGALALLVKWRPGRPTWPTSAGSAVREGGAVGLFDVANYFSRNGDDLLIGWRWGTASLGLYRRAYDLLVLPSRLVIAPVAQVAIPFFSRTVQQPERYLKGLRTILDQLTLVTLPVAVLYFVFPEVVVRALLGDEWLGAANILRWMAPLAVLQPLIGTVGWIFLAEGRAAEYARFGVGAAIVNMCGFVIAVRSGPEAVALTYTLVSLLAVSPIAVLKATSRGPTSIRVFLRPIVRVSTSGVLASVVLWPLRGLLPTDASALPLAGLAVLAATTIALRFQPGGRDRFSESLRLVRTVRSNTG